jgi:hypothetical protein
MAVKQEIEVFVPQLPHTPGWVAMTPSDRDWLQEHTSAALSDFRDSGLKAISCCIRIAEIQNFLDGKSMTFTNWVRTAFGSSERTAYRWLASYKEQLQVANPQAILYLAQEGLAGVNNTIQPKELTPVLKALPAPKTTDKKSLEGWRQRVSEELRTRRSKRRKRVTIKLDAEDAMRDFVIVARRLLRESDLNTSADQRKWLTRALGYLMDLRAIAGTITAERTSIPDGWMPVVGRPRKGPKAKTA